MKYVIFDFDGTLVDSKSALLTAWNTIADKHNFKKVKIEEIEELRKISIKERSLRYDFPLYKLPIIMPLFYQTYNKSIKEVTLIEGMKELLDELNHNGYKIAIISSNSKENIEGFMKDRGVQNISTILCSSRIFGKDKIMKKFLKEKQLGPDDVIYVGDEERDIVACKKVGIKVVWVEWGYDAFEVVQREQPDYIATEPKDILTIIS
ncbi:HAD-IIIA family hydrolase [Lysinibacillus sp. BW-2-10]|uniref:HAD-IIIA family hydrolase n=1 Tax=Lysinibacillus sp. BW-2-10 TaxID=2590030 RepID=UPI00117C9AB5|nr:HAD-IIIA family hydrolase [Lysinibacillus sp. BW-2-10]TSI05439.1 HAD-IIIA family hydrolase [Lysinibacillus sp. BW-2-10]